MKTKTIPFLILAGAVLAGCAEKKVESVDTRPLVRTGGATNGVAFVDALRVQGQIRAKRSVKVSARIPGSVDVLLAEEGATVKKGTPLFRVDQVNVGNAVRAAKDDLAMAKAKLAQAEATDAKAKLDCERMARLLRDGAVTKDMAEKAEVAAKSHSAALEAARATVTKAETGLAVAEKNFADSEVVAPFDGILTKKYVDAGDFVGAGKSVFALDDTSGYEVCLSLNAAQYGRVEVGRTELLIGDGMKAPVTYKSPAVNPLTRTFEIRAAIAKPASLAAGMLADCRVVFARRTAQAVPTTAVANRGGGTCVFVVRDGKAVRVPVVAGLSGGGLREIVSPKFTSADRLIVEGMLLVNEGDEVRTHDTL